MWFGWIASAALAQGIKWSDVKVDINAKTFDQFKGIEVFVDEEREGWIEGWIASWDKTAPEVRIWVVWEDQSGESHDEGILTTTPMFVSIPEGSIVMLWASANEVDGGALDNIRIGGGTATSCADSRFGQTTFGTWAIENPDPNPNDADFSDWRLVVLDFGVPPTPCAGGQSFVGGNGTFTATARNHAGLESTTAPLTIDFVP